MIENLINSGSILFELTSEERDEVLAELTENLLSQDSRLDRNEIFHSLVEREEKMSTVVEKSIAVPHTASKSIDKTIVSLGISHKGVDFDLSPESAGNSIKLFFCIVFQEKNAEEHLAVLKDILTMTREQDFTQRILACKSQREVCDLICNFFS